MADEPKFVTRREFYSALGSTMNMVGIVALQTVDSDDNTLRQIARLVIAIGAIVAGLAYIVMALREKPAPRKS